MEIYVVKPGDTVNTIAASRNISAETIIYDNQLIAPYELAVGQALFLGTGTRNPTGTISVSGYAYPFINEWVLEQTLPYLSELPIFSYGFTYDGNLIPPLWDEDWMIALARSYGTQPILTLTPFGPDGQFNNTLISSIVNNERYTERLIQNMLMLMGEKGYQGVDIDFEYILAQDRGAFTAFVGQVAEAMRANGYHTSVALAPKTSADQTGLLYEGKDYPAIGAAANSVLLMTYEWGYAFGPPMAVAPLPNVRQVVEYAVSEIPSEKLWLGIPNYGYDWPLPYERGVTRATTLSNQYAVELAGRQRSEILFDERAQTPYFEYYVNGVEHEVWFEDVRSISSKLELADEYGLRGVGYWSLMYPFAQNWALISARYNVRKVVS